MDCGGSKGEQIKNENKSNHVRQSHEQRKLWMHVRKMLKSGTFLRCRGFRGLYQKKGPDELDCNTDEAFAAAEMVKESIRAEKEGYDAIVIYCFSDVGIDAIRENVRIPVIGPGETSLAAASMICNRFTVLTSESINIPRTYRRLMRNGIAREKMAAVRALDIPIGELRTNPEATEKYLKAVCKKAVEEDHSEGSS